MKTLQDFQDLLFLAIKLESINNFIIKNDVHYSVHSNGLVSFNITYRSNEVTVHKVNFLFRFNELTNNEIQAYYWELNLFLERHKI